MRKKEKEKGLKKKEKAKEERDSRKFTENCDWSLDDSVRSTS